MRLTNMQLTPSKLEFQSSTAVCTCLMQLHNSVADCARELFKPSKDLVGKSLSLQWRKKFFDFGFWIFSEWRHEWSSFGVILAHVAWPRAQPLGQSVSLKFSLETRLESESFESLIDFLAFLVQKLW